MPSLDRTPRPAPRVAIGPAEIAGCATGLARGLRASGAEAEVVLWHASPYGYGGARVLGRARRLAYAAALPFRREVVHYQFGSTWVPGFLDARWARAMGRAVVVTFHGDDCRLYSVAAERFPARGRVTDAADEPRRRDRLERLARHAHGALVADLELAAYVAPWYPRIYVTPLPIRLAPVASTAAEKRSGRPVVVHAATDPRVKGTDAIQAAAAEVARRRPLEFRVLTGTSHAEVLAELRRADIVVDQLNSVTSGVFALEALALGLPVLGELDRRALAPYQSELPVVPVTAETLAGKLEALLDDEGERARLGESGRAYVAATHAPEQVGRIALSIYRHAREAPPGTYEATSRGIVPLG